MAKVSFNKLISIKSLENKEVEINGQKISVITYLPIEKKVEMINELLNYVFDNAGRSSCIRYDIYFKLLVLKYYTNINITDKNLISPYTQYDQLELNNIYTNIIAAMGKEIEIVRSFADSCIEDQERYNYSALGIVSAIASNQAGSIEDIKKINLDLESIKSNPTLTSILENFSTDIALDNLK